MDLGAYAPYFNVTVKDQTTGKVYVLAQPVGFELGDLDLVVAFRTETFMDFPHLRTMVCLTRGIISAGVVHSITTSDFYIVSSTWDGHFQTLSAHLIPQVGYISGANNIWSSVISTFCSNFGKTAVFMNPSAAWLNWQFLPSGKPLDLNDAQSMFALLRQKYFVFATDNGNNQILFFSPVDCITAAAAGASPLYSINGWHFSFDRNVEEKRQYTWTDEYGARHLTAPTFNQIVQPDTALNYIFCLLDLGNGTVLAGGSAPNHGHIYLSTNYGLTWTDIHDTTHSNINAMISPAPGIILLCGSQNGYVIRSADNGNTWTEVYDAGNDSLSAMIDCGGGIIMASHNNPSGTPGTQIYQSSDYGLTWNQLQALTGETLTDCLVNCGGGVLLAGTEPTGDIWMGTLTFGNYTWYKVGRLGTETKIMSLCALPGGLVLAGTGIHGQIWRSTNYGASWTLVESTGDVNIVSLTYLGGGIVLAGSGGNNPSPQSHIFRSLDFGLTWTNIYLNGQAYTDCMLALGNGTLLIGTGNSAWIYNSLNADAALSPVHNLGFLPSNAVEPQAWFEPTPPKFDPFPPHLKYQSGDYIQVTLKGAEGSGNLLPGNGGLINPAGMYTYEITCAGVTEKLNLALKEMPWRMEIGETEFLTAAAGGALTPEALDKRVNEDPRAMAQKLEAMLKDVKKNKAGQAALMKQLQNFAGYIPLGNMNFNGQLDPSIVNLEALAEQMDIHSHLAIVSTVPTTRISGMELAYDTGNGKLYIWTGTSWVQV